MASDTPNHVLLWLAGLSLAGFSLILIRHLRSPLREQDEPPHVRSKAFPFFGHTIGVLRGSNRYFEKIASETPYPIFTIDSVRRFYVVNCPETAAAIYRNSKSLSFTAMVMGQAMRILNLPQSIMDRMNPSKDPSMPAMRNSARNHHLRLRPTKCPGMFRAGQTFLQGRLHDIPPEGMTVDLVPWLHELFASTGATALYGPENPMAQDPELLRYMKDFDSEQIRLQMPGRSLTARKGLAAIENVSRLIADYYRQNRISDVSRFLRERYDFIREYWDLDTISKMDIVILTTVFTNLHFPPFWMVCLIFGDPTLLTEIRREIEAASPIQNKEVESTLRINTAELLDKCPLLASTWYEMLRYTNSTISSRAVIQDTRLPGGYLLKKGANVVISCGAIHQSRKIWGPDANQFNPRRFLERGKFTGAKRKSLLPFGGGLAWCPGRHFVQDMILGFTVTMVMGFEVEEVGKRILECPVVGPSPSVQMMKPPVRDVRVDIRRRVGYEGLKFEMEVPLRDSDGSEETMEKDMKEKADTEEKLGEV